MLHGLQDFAHFRFLEIDANSKPAIMTKIDS